MFLSLFLWCLNCCFRNYKENENFRHPATFGDKGGHEGWADERILWVEREEFSSRVEWQRQSTITRCGDENTYRSAYKHNKSSSFLRVAASEGWWTLLRLQPRFSPSFVQWMNFRCINFTKILPSYGRWKKFNWFSTLEVLQVSNFLWWTRPWTATALSIKFWKINFQSSKIEMNIESDESLCCATWRVNAARHMKKQRKLNQCKGEKKAQNLKGNCFPSSPSRFSFCGRDFFSNFPFQRFSFRFFEQSFSLIKITPNLLPP